ncbi:MAG: hypothetical protein P1S60_13930 [Anaerolineae bacterium]|nr:hypothetical protein [Anaerolineae bacterium]
MKHKSGPDNIPQILKIITVKADGKVRLVKVVKDHLGLKTEQPLFLDLREEVRLSTEHIKDSEVPVSKGGILVLPEEGIHELGITGEVQLGLVERPNAVALKVVEIEEVPGDKARLIDIETPLKIVRTVETAPLPETAIPMLQRQYGDLVLQYDIQGFIQGRQTFIAWRTRQLLGCPDDTDNELHEDMVDKRLEQQEADGSWAESIPITARNLRELAVLGLGSDQPAVQNGVSWLLNRAQSEYNPGMFLGSDALVAEQADVMARRKAQKHGTKPRFRQLKKSEQNQVVAGDSLIYKVCGPRIMWPNGLAMEALLALGYENDERVQTILATLTSQDWCECGYQNGAGAGVGQKPVTEAQLSKFEALCMHNTVTAV